jgi:hypothetical protein
MRSRRARVRVAVTVAFDAPGAAAARRVLDDTAV